MATKPKAGGMHTAGIYSDMTVDGPEIGTLVVIVDRAKNLPNRKTIGKQDPYCAARLGKEAKKTETDRRGGQTPRWDQELRFTVHDSPDYYQLKVSVFNDDKKTDLIGETWVNLQEVILPGGGQSDVWHNLSCKGKYAGEIRIEITYYDTRPKQEKAGDKVSQASTSATEDGATESLKGPRQPQQKTPVKRRPLPSDPITGAPPQAPNSAPIAAPIPETTRTLPRGYSQPAPLLPEHVQAPLRGYSAPSVVPTNVQTPSRGYQSPNHIPNQSPLQNFEYNTPQNHYYPQPEPQYSQPDPYGNGHARNDFVSAPGAMTPAPNSYADDRYGYESRRDDFDSGDGMKRYGNEEEHDQYHFDSHHSPYELPQPDDFGSPPSPGGPPPPPPVHRSQHGSTQASPAPPLPSHGSFDSRNRPQYENTSHDGHRHSMPGHQRQTYQPYRSPTHDEQPLNFFHDDYRVSPPRHHSYDSRYDHQDYSSMQPTVEDAPSSPTAREYAESPVYRRGGSQTQHYEDRRYDQVSSPAPLNLTGRGSATPARNNAPRNPSHQYSNDSMSYGSSPSQLSYRDRANTDTTLSSRTSYNPLPPQAQQPRRLSEDPSTSSYSLPPVPTGLVAGIDPVIAQEISDRIYDEKRASFNRNPGNSARGYQNSPQHQANKPHPLSFQEPAHSQFESAPITQYDDRQSRFAAASTQIMKPRAISPDPRMPVRKSVSPSPGPPPGELDTRRLSGVPFGPDSYNAFNPTIANSTPAQSLSAKYDIKQIDPDAKIIAHDGREVDPSDHIPESNYAPLLETKAPKYASQLPDRNYRPSPKSTAQEIPTSGRRPLRTAGRPHSMATSSPLYLTNSPMIDPSTPPNRNRLQKKANRMSAQPAPYSSPLVPITPHQDNSYTPRSQNRGNEPDYNASENYAPQYGGSPGHRGSAGPPPIPAKVPMQLTANSHQHTPGGGDPWALLEEMKNIDLGSGRARRRQY